MRKAGLTTLTAAITIAAAGIPAATAATPAKSWMGAVCSSVTIWQKSVVGEATAASDEIKALKGTKAADTGGLKSRLIVAFDEMALRTDVLRDTMAKAGTPDFPHGRELAKGLGAALSQLAVSMRAADAQARALPTGSAKAFTAAALKLASSLASGMSGIGPGLATLDRYDAKLVAAAA